MKASCWNLKFSPKLSILGGKHSIFGHLKSFHVSQEVEVRSEKHDCQGQVERFCEAFPLAVTLRSPPTKLMEGGNSWDVEFPPHIDYIPLSGPPGEKQFWPWQLTPVVAVSRFCSNIQYAFQKVSKMWRKAVEMWISPWNRWGSILVGKHNFFWDLQSFHVRQQLQVRSEKHDHQGQVEKFCEAFPLAVTLGTPPRKLMEGGISWNVEFPPHIDYIPPSVPPGEKQCWTWQLTPVVAVSRFWSNVQ